MRKGLGELLDPVSPSSKNRGWVVWKGILVLLFVISKCNVNSIRFLALLIKLIPLRGGMGHVSLGFGFG